ncbi:phage holin family protein [Caulobacter sp. SSI4214]|jgi:putative membrane protein|uniref:phage holin family protein n=1 Tax=Caulobacter sp. SSI4214 TaxID=2575739 RepID=UPI00143AA2A6|nr:phage holin family protein [Caulobacter sp. SSI4214]
MVRFIFRILIAAAGLWLSSRIVPGVWVDGWTTLLIAGFLLGVVNAVVRPVVTVLTFPLTLVTLGLFLLVVNAAMIGLVAWMLGGHMQVHGLLAGIEAAIVTGVVSWGGHILLGDDRRERE